MVVEDELVASWSIQEALESFGHEVVANVTTGAEAIQQAASIRPSLVLMDILLEGEIDGITATEEIYGRFGIPVIYLTAHSDEQTLQRAIATEPFGYLVKPFNKTALHTTIHVALRRYELENRLERTEQWLSTTLNSIGDGTITTNDAGQITFMNPVAEELTGWSQQEALGKPASRVLNFRHGKTRKRLRNPLLQAIEQGERVSSSNDCILRTKKGQERAVSNTATPIRNSQEAIIGGVLIVQDISQRKQAEELLHQREQEFRALAENSPDIVARFDVQMRYVYVNPILGRLIGIPAQAYIGRTNREMGLSQSMQEVWDSALAQVFATAKPAIAEFELMTPEGFRVFQVRVVPEFLPDGKIHTALSVARDITEHTRARESSRQQVEWERLLQAIAYRIRQSLDLEAILETTVIEVRQLLHANRVIIYRFEPDWSGYVVAESVEPEWTSMLGHKIFDPCLAEAQCITPYLHGHIGNTEDIFAAGLAQCYVDLLAQFEVRANLVIPILHPATLSSHDEPGSPTQRLWGFLVAQQCGAPRRWRPNEIDILVQLSVQLSMALQQSALYRQMRAQAQREQVLSSIVQAIHQSLDLETIFETAVAEIGQNLQLRRVEIVQYLPDRQIWLNVASYRNHPDLPDARGLEISDLDNPLAYQLKQGHVVYIDDYGLVGDEANQPLTQTFPGAWLLVPLKPRSHGTVLPVWGSLSLNHSASQKVWQTSEIELAEAIADQLAIAIQQSLLYQQVQQLNTRLEEQVQQRTEQLQQAYNFEATLKRITDRVRDSLDETQILQSAVRELVQAIGAHTCNAALYNLEQRTSTICYEYSSRPRSFQEVTVSMADFPPGYHQLLQGQYFQYCTVQQSDRSAILSCPVSDDHGVLGDLWLIHDSEMAFSDQDIRLVQMVASQCAIALRQTRLFEAANLQVQELERLNRLKDEFLSTVSHELRTPMANVRMATQMLEVTLSQMGVLGEVSNAVDRYFNILKEEGLREISLIDDLLDLSRVEAETEPPLLVPVDLGMFLPYVVEPFFERAQSQKQTLEVDVPKTLPLLETDLTYLQRILSELLENACKYTPSGGTIRLTAYQAEQRLNVVVSNTGVEIPPYELDRIFDKFYRIPNSDPWKHGGTGLGLALAKKLIEHINAAIAVSSGNQETIFTLSLPLTTQLPTV